MQAFSMLRPATPSVAAAAGVQPGSRFIAGGTDLLQLARNNVEAPTRVIDIESLPLAEIQVSDNAIRLGAMARMSDVGAHPAVRERWPVISQALLASASPQVRNMGTMGGNLLQRTRCGYFRDTGFNCNKREPGSGCAAIHGENRMLAILGGSDQCIATNPSDFSVALVALDATIELQTPAGAQRTVPVRDFHRLPGSTPHIETVLAPGELITGVLVQDTPTGRRSHYLKVRDRASFEFALVSVAVGIELDNGTIHDVRVAAGGVGTRPWHLPEVEDALRGKKLDPTLLQNAAMAAGQGAHPAQQNGFKLTLLRRSVLRALQTVTA
jgi:xanthine dehydrogenase YagS FAD-binding subunit